MGLIREPEGIDLIIGPSILTEQDRQMISEIIANYKRSGKLQGNIQLKQLCGRTTSRLKKKKVLA